MVKIVSILFGAVSLSEFLVILTAKMFFLPHQLLTIATPILSLLSFLYCSQRNAMVEFPLSKRTLHSTVLFLFRERIRRVDPLAHNDQLGSHILKSSDPLLRFSIHVMFFHP